MSDFGDSGELVPDLAEPIRGYRAWTFDGLRLTGMGGVIWPAGEPLKARCQTLADPDPTSRLYRSMAISRHLYETREPRVAPHECPSADSNQHNGYGCGIYAYKSPARFAGQRTWVDGDGNGSVIGCVELGGKVYEHEHGYRAEYAMPVVFYGELDDPGLMTLAAVYGATIETPPWEDPDVIRQAINEAAKKQAEDWDRRIERATERASVRAEITADTSDYSLRTQRLAEIMRAYSGATDAPDSPKYPNKAGYSDDEIRHIAKETAYSPGVIADCITKYGHRYPLTVFRHRLRTRRKPVHAVISAAYLVIAVAFATFGAWAAAGIWFGGSVAWGWVARSRWRRG